MAWIPACTTDDIDAEDVIRFDHGTRTFAIFRSPDDEFFATDGICTHERTCLADGLVMTMLCASGSGYFQASGLPLSAAASSGWSSPRRRGSAARLSP